MLIGVTKMKSHQQKGLTIFLWLFIIAALFMVAAFYFVNSTQEDVDKQNKQYLNELAVQNAYTIKSSVDIELDNIVSLANIISSQGDTFNVDDTMEILGIEANRGKFKRLGYISLDGVAITTDNGTFDASDREYYKKALLGESNVSDVMKDKIDDGYINVYAVPLYCQGKIEGVIFATNDTSIFSDVLNIRTFGGKGYSYIIQKDGTPVVFGSDNKDADNFDNLFDVMKRNGTDDQEIHEMSSDIEKNESGIIEYERDGDAQIGAYYELGINDWYVVSTVSKKVISESLDRLVYRTRVSTFIIVSLLLVLVGFILRQNRKNSHKLEMLAYEDPLTGGNNLNRFKSLAREAVKQNTDKLYMVRIDIDNFKLINDMYGYAEGDHILLEMNRLISEILASDDVYGRTDNDNFLCLIKRDNLQEVLDMGITFRTAFKTLLKEKGKRYIVNFTTGVYKLLPGEDDIEKMIDKATMAHRKAKLLPSERKFCVYNDEILKDAVNVKDIEDVMDRALEQKEFVVYLQPKYNIFNNKIVGAEALVRWKRDGKILQPAEFLPVFEKNGFVANIDMYVLEEVCKMQRKWLDEGIQPVPVSINQSKALVYGNDYIEKLSSIMSKYNMPSQLIELELLETIIHDNVEELKMIILRLAKQGFLICIDDFGSGYSSLNLLKDIGADVLKIDREFLSNAESNERAEVVLSHIINLAGELKMSTVVEGVETESQANLLKKLNCCYAQGFLYARPMPQEDYEHRLRNKEE